MWGGGGGSSILRCLTIIDPLISETSLTSFHRQFSLLNIIIAVLGNNYQIKRLSAVLEKKIKRLSAVLEKKIKQANWAP